jgi:hypothetical protein
MSSLPQFKFARRATARANTRLKRVGQQKIVAAGPPNIEGLLDFSNSAQFDAIPGATTLLYYQEAQTEVLFDPEGDQALFNLHVSPFTFDNEAGLPIYDILTGRARYQCKSHPNQELARQQAALELVASTDDIIIMVYRRDPSVAVTQRNKTPFRNPLNGLETAARVSEPLILFHEYSNDPFASASLVWQREARLAATIGLIGLRIDQVFDLPPEQQQ